MITPLNERYAYREALVADNMGRSQLLLILPEDDRLLKDAELYLKTKQYIQRHRSSQDEPGRQAIIAAKGNLNGQRLSELNQRLTTLLGRATAYVNGQAVDLPAQSQARTRVHQAFRQLIGETYPNLRMVKRTFSEEEITQFLTLPAEQDLFEGILDPTEAELEVIHHVERNRKQGQRSNLKSLLDHFGKKPYGWAQPTVLGLMAQLFRRNKVEIRFEGQEQTGQQVSERLNNRNFDRLLIEPVAEVDRRQVNRLHQLHRDLFDRSNPHPDPKTAAGASREAMATLAEELRRLINRKHEFPFVDKLTPVLKAAEEVRRLNWNQFYDDWLAQEDQWLDWKEELIDPIRSFVNGSQGNIYLEVRRFLQRGEANLPYLTEEAVAQLSTLKEAAAPYRGPQLQQAKQALDELKGELLEKIQQTRAEALQEMDRLIAKLQQAPEYPQLPDPVARRLTEKLGNVKQQIAGSQHISVIKERLSHAKNELFSQLTKEMIRYSPPPEPMSTDSASAGEQDLPASQARYTVYTRTQIELDFPKSRLQTQADLEAYLTALRDKYQQILDQGDQIEV